jgi:hypothetical protein
LSKETKNAPDMKIQIFKPNHVLKAKCIYIYNNVRAESIITRVMKKRTITGYVPSLNKDKAFVLSC